MRKKAQSILYILAALAVICVALLIIILYGETKTRPFSAPSAQPAASIKDEPTFAPAPPPAVFPAPTVAALKPGQMELPVIGATGYTAIETNLRSEPGPSARVLQKLPPGTAFRIMEEQGQYWKAETGDFSGWIQHKYCMINLPDVIPSIIYENTNASKSRIRSSGKDVPGVTGQRLYDSSALNPRFGRDEFIMPAMYSMAKKICAAQQAALKDGNSLKIYEAYRPYGVQRTLADALAKLAKLDPEVNRGISAPPWKISWFISNGTSNHQSGLAIDVSLARIHSMEVRYSGNAAYNAVGSYTEYAMPSPIHELSIASAAFISPVSSTSESAWKSAAPAKAMNEAALSLQRYCTDAGLTPLASEWWHFNDLSSAQALGSKKGQGEAVLTVVFSVSPQ